MKALVGAFNQEKALVGAFSVIVKTDCATDGSFYSTNYNYDISADHLIVAGDFNVDPRDNEDTYKSIHADGLLTNANPHPEDCDSKSSTLGNPRNTYTEKGQKPVVYDYIWYKPAGTTLTEFKVLNLITEKEEISLSDHQALSAKFTLTKSS